MLGEVQEEECHFRKAKTTPVNIKKRALSYGTFFSQIVNFVEQHIDFPTLSVPVENIPSPCDLSREKVERIAEKCRIAWGLTLDAPIHNMTRVLENAGCIVTTFEGVSEKVDAFSFIRSRAIVVRNTDKGNSARSRFDQAHEGGHIILHAGIEAGDPILDEQANNFASAFLMPRSAFIGEFPTGKRLSWRLLLPMAQRWGVSLQALIRRAYDLGLIDAVQYRFAHVHINKNISEDEIKSIAPPDEKSEVLPQAFELLEEHKGLTCRDIARALHFSPSIFSKFGIEVPEDTGTSNVFDLRKHKALKYIS